MPTIIYTLIHDRRKMLITFIIINIDTEPSPPLHRIEPGHGQCARKIILFKIINDALFFCGSQYVIIAFIILMNFWDDD